ncbi:hypothetical protein [Bacillus benzoevorans]|uniref:Uncharacterized protein n=1 Tax=Bacillus benzoevorans TaxID=1456 RepID=A0A7X0LWS3_9BACI|nr:hypothetical protein [Bacillus benzoevorans]MBB6447028.1 hypothetical protein [Bacillus benzoevorans]
MSFITVNPAEIVKKQYFFKLRANIDAFSSLVGLQLLAILISLWGTSSSGIYSGALSIDVRNYSSDIVIAFTMIWGFTTAITITTKPFRHHDFTFVTNRVTSGVSNVLFLLTASVVGGILAMLARNLIILIVYSFFNQELYGSPMSDKGFFLGLFVSILYIFFVCSIGYLIGTLVQVNKAAVLIIPALVIGSIFFDAGMQRNPTVMNILEFYFLESSPWTFALKALITAVVLYSASIAITNRMEVRK